jgi:predicted nucleotidyltransferase component of viral defense system
MKNLTASVRQRLMNVARARHEEFGLVLTRYGIERLLYRLSQSEYRSAFVLKGALLFELWTKRPHRPTRDLDLASRHETTVAHVKKVFAEICAQPVVTDGLTFDPKAVRAETIREELAYQGARVRCLARLGNARIPLQVDVGFGDVITPGPVKLEYPPLLDFPAPRLQAYPRETMVAEKFHALVRLGLTNSRMKDFYDLWTLARDFPFDGQVLAQAFEATFRRQKTEIPATDPLPLTAEFVENKAGQWRAFLRKNGLDAEGATLERVTEDLQQFLLPPAHAVRVGTNFNSFWPQGGRWKESPTARPVSRAAHED